MDYTKLPLEIRNKNIATISVVLNTMDALDFPNVSAMCKIDLERFKTINFIQNQFSDRVISKQDAYNFLKTFETQIQ